MKKLSKNEMKMVFGGDDEPVGEIGGDGLDCKKKGVECSTASQCCSLLDCYNAGGESGKKRCN